ncbi:conserved hypothetical protein [Pediculus humanus corporis]|uniref:Deoxyhypusine hydroxylase n=1 Tax=Pediculus humanus subsp. corporis TaxID=121224 RepID=E0VTF2_PEDHC|nr:uncharacterized protein Phum_PHUM432000 [Pediculus humanus corporis]EEB16658.1 conserved hypothetical protein [Pediculus humanus corporis]
MVNVPEDKIKAIGAILNDSKKPLKARFRALFSLRNINNSTSVACISEGFSDPSALLKHELAYCLGQMQNKEAIPLLIKILEDKNQEPIVRHEAAEALGAIGLSSVAETLKTYSTDKIQEVAETCELALARLSWLQNNDNDKESDSFHHFQSVDPAPASNETDLVKLDRMLLNESLSLFDRYKAMFALRNIASDESALILTKGLKSNSALFSHEIAFILGQLQNKVTIPALIECLKDKTKNEMVRHECAEALGAIATEECFNILKTFLDDEKRVVRESCEIALDICDYENTKEFQYALT